MGNFLKEEGAVWLITEINKYGGKLRFGIKCVSSDGFWEIGEEVLDSISNLENYELVSGNELNMIKAELL